MDKKLDILIVDDDTETRQLYAEILRGAGFGVREAEDGLAGLQMANEARPDAVVSGIIMPRMDGYGLVEELKKGVATSTVPVVFLSHLGREEDRKRAKEIGVRDFIVRDMTPVKDVVERIKTLFSEDDYVVGILAHTLDAGRLARDFDLNHEFTCGEGAAKRVALRLRPKDREGKTFEAEIVCL